MTYGFHKDADFQATDINVASKGANFKVNYRGNIVPFRLDNIFSKEQIYSILSSVCVGTVKSINLVEIFQNLKFYKSDSGETKL